jgi:diadenosine tetraphosphatase ApaH/serine/threonine PP2A family protein phosphatase
MRIAILSDVHGNLEALQRVFDSSRQLSVDTVVCLGDIVGYGPFPNECVDLLRQVCRLVVKGNHDAGCVGDVPHDKFNTEGEFAIAWTERVLTPGNKEFLRILPLTAKLDDVTLVHASPREPERWTYIANWALAAGIFPHFTTSTCCLGHTHIPGIVADDGRINTLDAGHRHIINPGSVGQPRDGDPRASFALLDTDTPSASIIRVPYDVASTATAIRAAGLPEFLARRLEYGI